MRKLAARLARSWHEFQAKRRLAHFQEQRKREQARRAAAAVASGGQQEGASSDGGVTSTTAGGGEERGDNRDDRLAGTCVVCIDRPVEVVFASCGHMCCCEKCGLNLTRCPICRLRGGPIKVYRP